MISQSCAHDLSAHHSDVRPSIRRGAAVITLCEQYKTDLVYNQRDPTRVKRSSGLRIVWRYMRGGSERLEEVKESPDGVRCVVTVVGGFGCGGYE